MHRNDVPSLGIGRFSKDKLLPKVLKSCLTLKGLLVQKTKITEDCRKNLSKLLNDLVEKENEMKKEYLKACIDCLQVQIEESLTSPLVRDLLTAIVLIISISLKFQFSFPPPFLPLSSSFTFFYFFGFL